jgi:hypothetical protein
MKRRDFWSLPMNMLLAFAIGFLGIGCLATAFSYPVSYLHLALICMVSAVAVCLGLRFQWGFLALPVAAVLFMTYFYQYDLLPQLQQTTYTALEKYHRAYNFPIPDFAIYHDLQDVTQALGLIAMLTTQIAAASLSHRRSAGAVAMALLALAPCLVVTDTPPASVFVFGLLATVMVILLTHGTRRRSGKEGSKLALLLLIPVLLLNWLAMTVIPREGYESPQPGIVMDKLEQIFGDWFPNGNGSTQSGSGPSATQPPNAYDTVELGEMGPNHQGSHLVMQVHSTQNELIYLRGRHFGSYDGYRWLADVQAQERLALEDQTYLHLGGQDFHNVRITTAAVMPVKYLSYYPSQYTLLENGQMENNGQTIYVQSVHSLSKNWKMRYVSSHPKLTLDTLKGRFSNQEAYLQLPDSTRQQALRYLQQHGIGGNMHVQTAVEHIAGYVRNSATYDLNTAPMDPDATDFAMWFLTEGETGYCVHFATAAVVLLRAAGIPARYVEGYAVQVEAYLPAPVRQYHAHAWVEYYLPDLGWVMLETTPGQFLHAPEQLPTTGPTVPPTARPPTTLPPTAGPTLPPTTVPPTTQPPTTGPTRPTTSPTPTTRPTMPSATQPSATQPPTPPEPSMDWTPLWRILQLLGLMALVLTGIWLQHRLRLHMRKKRLEQGEPNARALRLWRHTRYLARLRRQQAPEALEALALKARFSQHTLTDAELQAFEAYFARSIAHLQRKNLLLQFVYRWILAIW